MAAEELARIQQEDVKVFFNMVAQHQENFDNIWGKKTLEHKVWMFVLWVGVDVGVYECTYVGKSYVYVCEYVLWAGIHVAMRSYRNMLWCHMLFDTHMAIHMHTSVHFA